MASRTSAPVAPVFDFDFDAPPSKKPAIPTFDAPDFDQAAFDALSPRSKESASGGKSKSLKQKTSASPTSTQIDGPPQTPTKTRKVSSSDLANQAKAEQEQESKQSAPAKKPKKALKKAMSAQVTSSAKKQAEGEEEQDENTPPPAPKKASKPVIKNINAISEDQELDDNKLDMIRAAGDSDEEEAPVPQKSRKPRYSETPKASSSASTKKIARTQSSAVNEANPANPSSSAGVGVIGGIDEEDKVESSTGTSGPVDAWEKMLDGSVMMKFGKAGEPHFRIVGLTEDKKYVVYFSKGKKRSQTKIEVAKIIKITEGLKGKGFTNAIALAGEFRNLCFSIWYDKDNTLDLMAADENEYKIWTKGLLSLVEEAKNPSGLVNGCMVDLKAQDRFNRTKLIAENRRMVKERRAIQDDFTKINKRLNDILAYTEDMRILHAFTRSETWVYAQKILDYLKKVKDLRIDTGNINELDYEAWWMQAQLEALQNLMEAVDVHI